MKLVVQEFLTLDGVSQGPGSPDEDTSDGFTRGGWFVPYVDEEFMEIAEGWLGRADGLLFGRRTYENFARDWPTMTDHPFAAIMNGLPKYVATKSLTGADWNPTTILAGNIAAEVDALKRQPGRELQIHGSSRLAQSLLAAGLVDQLRLAIAPVVVGRGRRLFPADGTPAGLRPVSQRSTTGGLSVHVFEPAGLPSYGVYEG
ncbi:dihydrofolate reductase family protein [Streptomyces endophyticus]|uniref:Dihydrofolate reductase family protein n=1 Tax=Streptomyces endophyticus TaxID=714166 RepID=A0ABU6FI65_9ACTN|nr:dihydrofolate reductase family protein [Streptomyces endophyticus]MEB8342541.1 dihydrofolate reductase family protein [Streptomyces endophyticus]